MILLTTPVVFAQETSTESRVASARIDLLNNRIALEVVYGSVVNGSFAASAKLPATLVTFYLSSGRVSVDGIMMQSNGQPLTLSAAVIAAVENAMAKFASAAEAEVVNLGIFSGTVS